MYSRWLVFLVFVYVRLHCISWPKMISDDDDNDDECTAEDKRCITGYLCGLIQNGIQYFLHVMSDACTVCFKDNAFLFYFLIINYSYANNKTMNLLTILYISYNKSVQHQILDVSHYSYNSPYFLLLLSTYFINCIKKVRVPYC